MRLAGKRPSGVLVSYTILLCIFQLASDGGFPAPPHFALSISDSDVYPTLLPSIFNPPVPCLSTLLATVPSSGLRASTHGSWAGLRAVP